MASTLDILPTIASLAGAKLPQVMLDGVDMTNILISQGKVLIHLIKYLNTFVKLMMVFFPRVKGSSWCSIPPTPVRYTASSPSGWKNTRPTSIHKVGNVQANAFLSKPKQHFWLFFFFISCASGASHSSTTPDQDCSIFASLKVHDPPLLFDLDADPSEHYPLSLDDRPDLQEVLGRIRKVKEQFEGSMVFGESQISKGTDPSLEPCCSPQCGPKPDCCRCWWDTCSHLWLHNAQFYTFIFLNLMVINRWSTEAFLVIVKANIMSVLNEEISFSQTDLTNAWSDFYSLLDVFSTSTRYQILTFASENDQSCRWEQPDNNKDFRHQAYILFIRPNPWQGSMIFFFYIFFFSLEFYKSLFLKIQVRICLFCHILRCSRYTVRNLVTVVKPIVWFNCLRGYIGLYHPRRLILCSCVWKERCDLGCTKIEKKWSKASIQVGGGSHCWNSRAINLSDAVMVFHLRLRWLLTCSKSRLDINQVGVSHISDVRTNVRAQEVLLLCP